MAAFRTFDDMQRKFLSSGKARLIALAGIFGIFLLFLFFKGCSSEIVTDFEYSIGQDTEWREINLLGKQRNLVAFNQDLLTQIAKTENLRFKMVPVYNHDLISDLEQERVRAILTTLAPGPVYEGQFVFSDPYFLTGPVLVIPSSSSVKEWEEIPKKIIGTEIRSPSIARFEKDPTVQKKFYDEILTALSDLSVYRIDGAIFPAIPAHTYVNTFYKNELKIVTPPLTGDGIRLVAKKNEIGELLVSKFNEGLKAVQESGAYAGMLERWGLVNVDRIQE